MLVTGYNEFVPISSPLPKKKNAKTKKTYTFALANVQTHNPQVQNQYTKPNRLSHLSNHIYA